MHDNFQSSISEVIRVKVWEVNMNEWSGGEEGDTEGIQVEKGKNNVLLLSISSLRAPKKVNVRVLQMDQTIAPQNDAN
jgi:hypothetical protein